MASQQRNDRACGRGLIFAYSVDVTVQSDVSRQESVGTPSPDGPTLAFWAEDQQPLPVVPVCVLTEPVVDGVWLVPDVGLLPMPVLLLVPCALPRSPVDAVTHRR